DRVRGLVRNPEHADDLRAVGAEPVVLDLEQSSAGDVAEAIADADAVVFAAGAGPGSGAARKETVDYEGAVKLLEAARSAGAQRYVIISSMGADAAAGGDDVFAVYLRAKGRADEAVMASDRAWTVVRPGRLTNDPGDGRVTLGRHVERGEVPREDIAAVVVATLDDDRTIGQVFEVVGGDTEVTRALSDLAFS
ncbi:MAG TPA: NAD(P)H-binding protein, partial [Euzebyales bacterium]|nr:NAD(P)H-binding protein [Euzebyales bacterium]